MSIVSNDCTLVAGSPSHQTTPTHAPKSRSPATPNRRSTPHWRSQARSTHAHNTSNNTDTNSIDDTLSISTSSASVFRDPSSCVTVRPRSVKTIHRARTSTQCNFTHQSTTHLTAHPSCPSSAVVSRHCCRHTRCFASATLITCRRPGRSRRRRDHQVDARCGSLSCRA